MIKRQRYSRVMTSTSGDMCQMRVLGVVGSPRKNGNTETLVDEVLRGAKEAGATVEKIFLNDLDIKPCQSTCDEHCKAHGNCKIADDMSNLYDKLYGSDAIVLGTPVYWWGPSAQMKAFIDRWYASSHPAFVKRFEGKKLALVAPFEDSDISTADPLVGMIKKSAAYLKMDFLARLLVTAGEKGVVARNIKAMNEAYATGALLNNPDIY